MPKTLCLLIALGLTLTGCDAVMKRRLTGTYRYTGKKDLLHALDKFELTGTKFVANVFLGETATDYTVEANYLYVTMGGGVQYRFQIVNPDTLRNEGSPGLEGTYVRVK